MPSGTGRLGGSGGAWPLAAGTQRPLGANSDASSCHDATFRPRGGAEHGAATEGTEAGSEREARQVGQGRPARGASEAGRSRCRALQWAVATGQQQQGRRGRAGDGPMDRWRWRAWRCSDGRSIDGWMDRRGRTPMRPCSPLSDRPAGLPATAGIGHARPLPLPLLGPACLSDAPYRDRRWRNANFKNHADADRRLFFFLSGLLSSTVRAQIWLPLDLFFVSDFSLWFRFLQALAA